MDVDELYALFVGNVDLIHLIMLIIHASIVGINGGNMAMADWYLDVPQDVLNVNVNQNRGDYGKSIFCKEW